MTLQDNSVVENSFPGVTATTHFEWSENWCMQSRVRGAESPTLMHSSRGVSGCACVCRPCITNTHPTTIVAAMPDVRNTRLFIFLSPFGYRIQILRSKAAGRKGRVWPRTYRWPHRLANYLQSILTRRGA